MQLTSISYQLQPESLNGIIFGDFEAQTNALRFNGSLAVEGNLTATELAINYNDAITKCVANNGTVNLTDYGLIVGGGLVAQNVTVNGAAYLKTDAGVQFIDNVCHTLSSTNASYDPVDFDALKTTALNISQYFASQKPNMVIRDGGFISDGQFQGDTNQNYYIFTFGLCKESPCKFPNYLYSSPEQIFFGGNWTGPWNSGYLVDKPIVFNVSSYCKKYLTYVLIYLLFALQIPVLANTVFNMSTANPSAGLEQAQVLFNVYPADVNGGYDSTGTAVWLRNTTEIFSGHALAPSVTIVENIKAGYNGQMVAARYFATENLLMDTSQFLNNTLPNATVSSL